MQASGQNLERRNQMKTKQLRNASEVWAGGVWAISPTAVMKPRMADPRNDHE
jgi:hypothetical protein